MVLDFIVIGIFVLSTIMGKRQGFLESVIKLGALVMSLVLGVMFTHNVSTAIYLTTLDEHLMEHFEPYVEQGTLDVATLIPGVVGETLVDLTKGALITTATRFTNLIITTLAFMCIVILVVLVAKILRRKLRISRKKKGLIGRVDGSVGLILGALRGVILVLLFLAFMLPVAGIWAPDKINMLSELLNHSYIAGPIYDINPLLKAMY